MSAPDAVCAKCIKCSAAFPRTLNVSIYGWGCATYLRNNGIFKCCYGSKYCKNVYKSCKPSAICPSPYPVLSLFCDDCIEQMINDGDIVLDT